MAVEVVQVVVDVKVEVVVVVTFSRVKVVNEMLLVAMRKRFCSLGVTADVAYSETAAQNRKKIIPKCILI